MALGLGSGEWPCATNTMYLSFNYVPQIKSMCLALGSREALGRTVSVLYCCFYAKCVVIDGGNNNVD